MQDSEKGSDKIINFKGIEKWSTILRKAIILQRAILRLRKKDEKGISSAELNTRAENMLIREAQKEISLGEIKKWDLVLDDDDIWRLAGRFELQPKNSKLIYLPRTHPIVTLLVRKAHEKAGHFGESYTLAKFRKKYWIEHGKSHVKT